MIFFDTLDLNYCHDTKVGILKEGAKQMEGDIVQATRSIIFVATKEDANAVATFLNSRKTGITAYPFYSSLGDASGDSPSGGAARTREDTLELWQASKNKVLIATTLGSHGLNFNDVDYVGHLTVRADIRTFYQEVNRAGRAGQGGRSVQAIHPLLFQDASWMVDDWGNGRLVSAFRGMLRIIAAEDTCRRCIILHTLGSIQPIKGTCAKCAVCAKEDARYAPERPLVDVTRTCCRIIFELSANMKKKVENPFVKALAAFWKWPHIPLAEVNACFVHLCASGVIDFKQGKGQAAYLALVVNNEAAAPIISRERPVLLRVTEVPLVV